MDDSARPGAGEVFRLMYRSHNRIPLLERRTELRDIFNQARSNNKRRQLSGALLLQDDWFVQTLEGDEQTVRSLYARIESDPRHERVELLETGTVPGRVFVRWAMARVAEDGESDINLIAHVEGIAAAAPRGDRTPEQADVLRTMRQAAEAARAATSTPLA